MKRRSSRYEGESRLLFGGNRRELLETAKSLFNGTFRHCRAAATPWFGIGGAARKKTAPNAENTAAESTKTTEYQECCQDSCLARTLSCLRRRVDVIWIRVIEVV